MNINPKNSENALKLIQTELEGINTVAVETVALISTAGEHISLDTEATEGVDKELYDALVALGWEDVTE